MHHSSLNWENLLFYKALNGEIRKQGTAARLMGTYANLVARSGYLVKGVIRVFGKFLPQVFIRGKLQTFGPGLISICSSSD